MAHKCLLPDRTVFAISGPDATDFLQNLLTNNVEALEDGHAQYTLLLTPQGKYLFDFFLLKDGMRFLVDCDADAAPQLLRRLAFYKLRAKVDLTLLGDEWSVAAGWSDDDNQSLPARPDTREGFIFADPRLPALGYRFLLPESDAVPALSAFTGEDATPADYDLFRLQLGVPAAADLHSERTFPMEAGLDLLHAIDFHKGCFVGQEVTSRTYRQGKIRKRLLPVRTAGKMPPAGKIIMAGDRQAGEIHSARGAQGLALLRLDRLNQPLDVDGTDIDYLWPHWLPTLEGADDDNASDENT
ncbi:MAG: folate-binding protein [Parvibaculaceae bacterium]|nr:folate-binding protein [Parvibaculaceae bacterium]